MPIGTLDPGTDLYDLAVNFGGYDYHALFGDGPECTPLPPAPQSVEDRCGCPSCDSQGWYAQSPACKFWRASCVLCDGTRFEPDYEFGWALPRAACYFCATEWQRDVRWFRFALRHPRAAAQRLRNEAARGAAQTEFTQDPSRT